MALEQLNNISYSKLIDIWNIGIKLFLDIKKIYFIKILIFRKIFKIIIKGILILLVIKFKYFISNDLSKKNKLLF